MYTLSDIELVGCVMSGNSALRGGGVYVNTGGSASLRDVQIVSGAANYSGGAVYVDGGQVVVNDSVLNGNRAKRGGGVAWEAGGSVRLARSNITDNVAVVNGGAYHCVSGTAVVSDCIVQVCMFLWFVVICARGWYAR